MEQSKLVRDRQAQRVLWRVLTINLVVAIAKLVVGLLTGALAMVADGIHSAIDTSANLIGIIGTAIAGRPADANHPYGHRRFETMATLAIGGLLLLAGWEILKTAVEHLFTPHEADIRPVDFIVMSVALVGNLITSTYQHIYGKRLGSDVLLAGAADSRTDILTSLSVVIGLVGSALGFAWFDTVVALLIVVVIGRTAYQILLKTTLILTDAIAIDPIQIEQVITQVPGVVHVIRVRSRGPVDAIYIDIDIEVERATTTDHTDAIANEIEIRVKGQFKGISEVTVHFAPLRGRSSDKVLVARAIADALGLSIHELTEVLTNSGHVLEMHVEVAPSLTLEKAHQQVSELEARVRTALPGIKEVVTHIEPAQEQLSVALQTASARTFHDQALDIARQLYPDAHWHAVTVRYVMGGYAIAMHCWLPGTMSIQEAHLLAEHVETQIRAALPQIQRVTVHTEPPEKEENQLLEKPSEFLGLNYRQIDQHRVVVMTDHSGSKRLFLNL